MTTAAIVTTINATAPARTDRYDLAFSEAYQKYYGRTFAFILSRTRDVETSRDLASTVFERAYIAGRDVREPASYRNWLFTIAGNVIAGHYRKVQAETRKQERVKDYLRIVPLVVDPEESVEKADVTCSLMRYVRRLSGRDQKLLSLKFDSELTHEEIAKVMSLTSGHVRVSIYRALKRLKARLDEDAPAFLN